MKPYEKKVTELIKESIRVKERLLADQVPVISAMADAVIKALSNYGTVYIFGNGGSAADAQHFAAELVGRFMVDRRALPAVALTTDTSILTAVGNDYGFDDIFVRQVQALVKKGDVVIAISTSGNSPNVLKAVEEAKRRGASVLGLTGRDGGKLKDMADYAVVVDAHPTARIQECHITVIHILCQIVEETMFGGAGK
jgi:D-sedoheptulose 7-phosphate isomerase